MVRRAEATTQAGSSRAAAAAVVDSDTGDWVDRHAADASGTERVAAAADRYYQLQEWVGSEAGRDTSSATSDRTENLRVGLIILSV